MADRAIREIDAKSILIEQLRSITNGEISLERKLAQIRRDTDIESLLEQNPWLKTQQLVAKPDQLIKRRGQNGLLKINANWEEAYQWVSEHMDKDVVVDGIDGQLRTFLIEPFVPHDVQYEYYLAIRSVRNGDEILFFRQGGVDVGDVESKAEKLIVPSLEDLSSEAVTFSLLQDIGESRREIIANFIAATLVAYRRIGASYLEINPLALDNDFNLVPLDLAVKLDDTASFECAVHWESAEFPAPFGSRTIQAERHIAKLDNKSGASLKFVQLNPEGRIWTLVAGGGASVVYADTIADLGWGDELANYGEYSGAPSDEETYEYTKTILELMTNKVDAQGRSKVLIIGGGIANFTDVAKTFKGIIKALGEFKSRLQAVNTEIYVRRGGPNYKEGLAAMSRLEEELGIPVKVFGPELHMTKIVPMALGSRATMNDGEENEKRRA
jgi:ATP citrate (pro-S)-lyase